VRPDILVVGGAHIDRRGRLFGPTRMGASNPGDWLEEPGGGAFNAASNLARLQRRVRLIAPRGGDPNGERVAAAAERAGIEDCPIVFLDRTTPSYTAILETDGNLVIALADMALYDLFSPRRIRARSMRESLAAAGRVLCDAESFRHETRSPRWPPRRARSASHWRRSPSRRPRPCG